MPKSYSCYIPILKQLIPFTKAARCKQQQSSEWFVLGRNTELLIFHLAKCGQRKPRNISVTSIKFIQLFL